MSVEYGTVGSIEDYTPGGTIPILKEFHRILKSEGVLCMSGDLKAEEGRDKAQVVSIGFSILERAVAELVGESHDIDWPPEWMKERLEEIGFKDVNWIKIDNGISLDLRYLKEWSSHLKPLIRRIRSKALQTAVLKELNDIVKAGKSFGIKACPVYAIYAKKP